MDGKTLNVDDLSTEELRAIAAAALDWLDAVEGQYPEDSYFMDKMVSAYETILEAHDAAKKRQD